MFGFGKSSEDGENNSSEKGSSQQILLLVLVLLLAVFGYLYFFTGIIKPRQQAPAPQPAQVKQPIPARPAEGGGAVPATGSAATPATQDTGAAATAKPAVPAATPSSATTSGAKPAATPAAPAASAAKPAVAPPAPAAKPASAPAAKPAPAATPVKPAPQAKTATKPAQVKATDAKDAVKAPKTAAKPASGEYTLMIGEYVEVNSVKSVEAKLKKLGIKPVARTKALRSEPMNRLYLGSFDTHQSADAALDGISKFTKDGFLLQENGRYSVYAGSYFNESKAAVEQDRLYEKGFKLVMKKNKAPVHVVRITAGRYDGKKSAGKDIASLKKQGISSYLVKLGK